MLILFGLRNIIKDKLVQILINHISTIIFFSIVYYVLYKHDSNTFIHSKKSSELSYLDIVQFSLITQTTVGYGHIIPNSTPCKIVNILQLLTIYGIFLI